jgi:lactobin A/cerein 7B family class IIb bacteriocin
MLKELNIQDMQKVNGGLSPLVVPVAVAVVSAVVVAVVGSSKQRRK